MLLIGLKCIVLLFTEMPNTLPECVYIRHGDKQTRCFRVFKPEKWEESKAAEEDLVMKLPSVAPGIFSPRESSSGSARK